MTNKRLQELIDEFVDCQPKNDKDDWYVSSFGAASVIMQHFIDFLSSKKIKLDSRT